MSFAGTEHYRERAAFLRKHEPLVYHRPYRIDLEALCDHIEDLQKKNEQAWERAALEARRVLRNGSKARKLEKKVEEQDKEIERLRKTIEAAVVDAVWMPSEDSPEDTVLAFVDKEGWRKLVDAVSTASLQRSLRTESGEGKP